VKSAGAALVALGVAFPGPALACRLALLLALDVSSSVDGREYLLQRNGLAAALVSPEVKAAFLDGGAPVAVAAFEWSGRYNQQTVLGWRLILSEADLLSAAATVAGVGRSATMSPTAIGHAMAHAAGLFRDAPGCEARTVDLSGDGENNEGYDPKTAYRHFPLGDVTVNALAIGGSSELDRLVEYYRAEVIKGPGAFVETAADYLDYERAMRRKLERELASRAVSALEGTP
jgi:hypothetical protein